MNDVNLATLLDDMFSRSIHMAIQDSNNRDSFSVNSAKSFKKRTSEEAIFLTISSHRFRLFVVIDFTQNQCSEFVKLATQSKSDAITEQEFYDYMFEFGNGLCGIFKREIGKAIPALGMSTPNLLSRDSINLMTCYSINKKAHYQISINDKILFYSSFYFLPSSHQDILVSLVEEDTSDTGELELF